MITHRCIHYFDKTKAFHDLFSGNSKLRLRQMVAHAAMELQNNLESGLMVLFEVSLTNGTVQLASYNHQYAGCAPGGLACFALQKRPQGCDGLD